MKHFEIAQWTDYVRGLAPALEREAMERHLAEGCEPCAQLAALVSRIHRTGAGEVTVPSHLVHSAKAVFPALNAPGGSPVWTLLPRLAATLVFSSLNDVESEGARSAAGTLVQAVYHAGDYAINLQIEPEPESRDMALVGQVIRRTAEGEPVADIPVHLMVREKLLAAAQSNRFGEFCLVSKFQNGLKLSMPLEDAGRRVEIPLDKMIAEIRP